VRPPDRIGLGRAFAIGLLLGAAFCSSIKTTFLAPALTIGWGGAWVFSARMREAWPLHRLPVQVAAAATGFAIVPGAIFGWLISKGTTLATLKFCLLGANQAPFETPRVIAALILAPLALAAAWWIARPPTLLAALRAAVFLSITTYVIALAGFSPELRKQTFLVVWPLVILLLVTGGTALLKKHRPALILPISIAVFVALFAHFIAESTLWNDGLRRHRELLTAAIKLTRPGDYLLDRKGETIFRERPIYIVYQHATLRGFNEGRLAEPPTSRLTDTHTAAALVDAGGLPDKMRKYLKQNFLPVGDDLLRVPGFLVKTFPENGRFVGRITVPQVGNYVVLTQGSAPQPFEVKIAGPQKIDLGPNGPRKFLLLWKPAWDAGFPPSPKAWALLGKSNPAAK
ncbi:MAG TPA: hypothetical protein VNB29_08855, partial [Chthoniobacterales bacterium]|nr:hypothetical protein [Chthoniobacterales bacterium]